MAFSVVLWLPHWRSDESQIKGQRGGWKTVWTVGLRSRARRWAGASSLVLYSRGLLLGPVLFNIFINNEDDGTLGRFADEWFIHQIAALRWNLVLGGCWSGPVRISRAEQREMPRPAPGEEETPQRCWRDCSLWHMRGWESWDRLG